MAMLRGNLARSLGSKAVRDLAWKFHDHPDPELRLTVARAIRTISPDEFDLLIQQEPKDWVRQAALQ